jgi:hypothetical protein
MLLNLLNTFSKTPAYLGCLEFVYTKRADEDDNDNDENTPLSLVSRFDHCVEFGIPKINDMLHGFLERTFIRDLEYIKNNRYEYMMSNREQSCCNSFLPK